VSYSVCLKCNERVSGYEKYCTECEKKYKQNKDYWKGSDVCPYDDNVEKEKIFKKDLIVITSEEDFKPSRSPRYYFDWGHK